MYMCAALRFTTSSISEMQGLMIAFDTVRRYLEYKGFDVNLCIRTLQTLMIK